MKWKKIIKSQQFIVILIFIFMTISLLYVWGAFSSPKPAILLKFSGNETDIVGFVVAKNIGSLQCIACVAYSGTVEVNYNGSKICEGRSYTISLGDTYLPVLCEESLFGYEGYEVKVSAIGKITPAGSQTITNYINKTLNLTFIKR